MKGSSFCDLNSVKQSELTEHVIDAIEGRFMNPKVVKRLRDELHRQTKREAKQANPDRIRKQLGTVETKRAKAKQRLLEVDRDMLEMVQEQIRDLQNQQRQLEASLTAAQTPQESILAEQDERIDKVMNFFSRLRETLQKADTMLLREFLRESVQRIEVVSEPVYHGKQKKFKLQRGIIRLRGDNLFSSPG